MRRQPMTMQQPGNIPAHTGACNNPKSRYYRAPEVFLSYKAAASPAMDIWAVGVTIVEMMR